MGLKQLFGHGSRMNGHIRKSRDHIGLVIETVPNVLPISADFFESQRAGQHGAWMGNNDCPDTEDMLTLFDRKD